MTTTTPMTDEPRIAIIGAGIGGLAAARALEHRSLSSLRIFEQAPRLRAAGAGITMQINAMLALDAIGCGEAVRQAGHPLEGGALRDEGWRVIQDLDLGPLAERLGTRGYGIHRADLLQGLARGLRSQITFGAALQSLDHQGGCCLLRFATGEEVEVDAVIGADGIHSAVRRGILGDEPLRYAGYTTWRGLTAMPADEEVGFGEAWGMGQRFGMVPVSEDVLYWFAVADAPEGEQDGPDPRAELLERFAGWPEQVRRVIAATSNDQILRTDTHDRPPSEVWGRGQVTLLGDAAHAMTPNLGQGGGQAVEDAVVLADALAEATSLEEGLRSYEARRRRRANMFVERSFKMGQLAHMRRGRSLRDALMRHVPDALTTRQLEALYRFEPQRAGA